MRCRKKHNAFRKHLLDEDAGDAINKHLLDEEDSFSLPRGDQTADSTREEASCRKKRLDPLSETSGCLALGRRLHAGKNMPEKTQRIP